MNFYTIIVFLILSVFIIIAILFAIFILSLILGAPYVSSRDSKIKKMVNLIENKEGIVFYDLGSGDGKVLIEAVKKFNVKKAVGIEINPLLVLFSRWKIKRMGLKDKIEIKWGNIFTADIKKADVVFCFLLQPTNNLLEKRLLSQLKSGVKVASLAFTFKKIPLIKRNGEIRLYEIP